MISKIEAPTYIYPSNKSRRDYQYDIVRACFTDNCLVALPTGLGKTFIAGVVMLNCQSIIAYDYAELTGHSLSVVPEWQDRVLGAHKAACHPAD